MVINLMQEDTAKSSLFDEGKIPFHAEPGQFHLTGSQPQGQEYTHLMR